MLAWLKDWFQKLLSDSPEVQAKKVAYLEVVQVGCLVLIADFWMNMQITGNWIATFTILTGFVTAGYIGGKVVEK